MININILKIFKNILSFIMLSNLIIINGIYDILCALSMLKILQIPVLNTLHLSMIKNYKNDNLIFERFFAYCIFTYGIIRILSNNNFLITTSYFIEAMFFYNECYVYNNLNKNNANFVIISCLILCYLTQYLL